MQTCALQVNYGPRLLTLAGMWAYVCRRSNLGRMMRALYAKDRQHARSGKATRLLVGYENVHLECSSLTKVVHTVLSTRMTDTHPAPGVQP